MIGYYVSHIKGVVVWPTGLFGKDCVVWKCYALYLKDNVDRCWSLSVSKQKFTPSQLQYRRKSGLIWLIIMVLRFWLIYCLLIHYLPLQSCSCMLPLITWSQCCILCRRIYRRGISSSSCLHPLKVWSHLLLFAKFLLPKSSHFNRNPHDRERFPHVN